VAFWDRPDGLAGPGWQVVAGPKGIEAPLAFRQRVMVYDARTSAGEELAPPVVAGMAQWAYIMDGPIRVGGQHAQEGDALSEADAPMPTLGATRDTTLVAPLLDPTAPALRAATISGQWDGL